jgi:hypothetical protein
MASSWAWKAFSKSSTTSSWTWKTSPKASTRGPCAAEWRQAVVWGALPLAARRPSSLGPSGRPNRSLYGLSRSWQGPWKQGRRP